MQRLCLIGAGNVGYHLGLRLASVGIDMTQVYSRDVAKAQDLATKIGAAAIQSLAEVRRDADLYLVAVHDNAISTVAAQLGSKLPAGAVIAHTSGATPASALAPAGIPYGIFYPLQSFRRERPVQWNGLPICYYAPDAEVEERLAQLARKTSPTTYRLDDADRRQAHLAAVFANNFSNYLLHIAAEVLAQRQLPLALLQPLIEETVARTASQAPRELQTGPAVRGDTQTIDRHLALLRLQHPKWEQLYEALSLAIQRDLA